MTSSNALNVDLWEVQWLARSSPDRLAWVRVTVICSCDLIDCSEVSFYLPVLHEGKHHRPGISLTEQLFLFSMPFMSMHWIFPVTRGRIYFIDKQQELAKSKYTLHYAGQLGGSNDETRGIH